MHELIEQLQQYHREKARHLSALENYVNDLLDNGPRKDYTQKLASLFEPFHNVAEATHHHNEELILGELRATAAPIHRRLDEIPLDHEAFNEIIDSISSKIPDESVSCEEKCSIINNFVAAYNDHAAGEESIFFPIADKYLKNSHWMRIKKDWR